MAKATESDADKGSVAEEALRSYFQQLGAFVVRGVKVRAGRDHVTDIDLWVYTRASVHARHIAIVDIKNKKRAKGYERLIWLKGLQSAVGADEAIVATTASKDELAPFASRMGLKLLSSQVFKAVMARYSGDNSRYSSEDLERMWRDVRIEGNENLAARMESNLVELGLGLSFTALNIWIDEAAKLLVYCYDHERTPNVVARAVMLCASLVAIAADYVGRNTAFGDIESRRSYFREGLIFGASAEGTSNRYLNFAERITTDYLDKTGAAASTIRSGFQRAVENLPVGPFIDFFARPAAGRELIDAANQLEAAAFSKSAPDFATLPPEGKTIIALLIDYADLDRRKFLRRSSGDSISPKHDSPLHETQYTPSKSATDEQGKRDDGLLL
ncbi:hypothetical protein [Novosphingobium arvoryzae]|uniref:hypothetical protein n=1 Tax=Novosphingobium arvoryzae TaxID=1256514 RepID=UPI0035B44DC9